MIVKTKPTASERRAEKIVDALEHEFFHGLCGDSCHFDWDHDKARQIIAPLIPQTAAEFEEELAQMFKDVDEGRIQSPGPSMFGRLRKAVHATEGMSIKCVLEAAIEKIEAMNEADKREPWHWK